MTHCLETPLITSFQDKSKAYSILLCKIEGLHNLWYNNSVRKTYRYRLLPTKAQIAKMQSTLDQCRWLYNFFLHQRKSSYEEDQKSISLYAQYAQLKDLRADREHLRGVFSQVLQDVTVRIDLAFQSFFRRVKQGEVPGYPRFKARDRYDSFTYTQKGFKLTGDVLALSKIGQIRMIFHRPIKGDIKTVTIRKQSGFWYACFSVEYVAESLPPSQESVGIDVGLKDFAYLSTDESIPNPKFYRSDEKDIKRASRQVERHAKGSVRRRKSQKALSKIHRRIANRRKNFAHQESRKVINQFGVVCVEDIHVNRMVHNHCLAKSIMDAAWSQFFSYLSYKAADAGRVLIKVNPAYTTQDCNRCGHRQKMPLSERVYHCHCCGLSVNRDLNASLNILRIGMGIHTSASA